MTASDDRKLVSGSVQARVRPVDRPRARAAIRELLDALGFEPDHPALATTPDRVLEAYADTLTGGYETDPVSALGEGFPVAADRPVVARDVPLLFVCPHHLLPARGVAHLAFVPRGRVPGLSRLTRLVDAVTRRLVLQEDIADGLVRALREGLDVQAALVRIEARHTCVAVEDFARRDAVFVTEASAGPEALIASLTPLIGGSVREPWSTSASEPPADQPA